MKNYENIPDTRPIWCEPIYVIVWPALFMEKNGSSVRQASGELLMGKKIVMITMIFGKDPI